MTPFNYTAAPARVVFGAGSLQHLVREIEALGAHRALVLSTPEQATSAQRVAELLGSRAAGVYAEARMGNPKVLLCDELSLGLAPIVIHEIYAAVPALCAEGMAARKARSSRSTSRFCTRG